MPNVGEIIDAARIALFGRQFMFGDVVAQYGSFRLHKYAIALKSGRLATYPFYWVVVGELAVPLFLSLREYSNVVKERQGGVTPLSWTVKDYATCASLVHLLSYAIGDR